MNDDLYTDNIYDSETSPLEYTELLTRMDRRLDEALCGSKGKRKKKKKGFNKSKKLKKRLKAVEKQNEKIEEFLRIFASQTQPPHPPLWLGLVEKSAPKLIDLASTIIQRKR